MATRIIELKPSGYTEKDMFDYSVTHPGHAYSEFREFTSNRKSPENASDKPEQNQSGTISKEQYLKNKKEASDARKKAGRIERLKVEMAKLEDELLSVEDQINGEAASDYKKIAELDIQKNEIEEKLMSIYEELEEI